MRLTNAAEARAILAYFVIHCIQNLSSGSCTGESEQVKVYDLMMQLAQLSPYADIGCLWDDSAADIDAIHTDADGSILLECRRFASMDVRLSQEPKL